jgi:hypothetical protein
MQIAPIAPVKVIRGRAPGVGDATDVTRAALEDVDSVDTVPEACAGGAIMEGSDTERNRDIVAYGHP